MKNLVVLESDKSSVFNRIRKFILEMDLIYYASDIAGDMEFKDMKELTGAINRAMNICSSAGVPLEENFKTIYRGSEKGLLLDYKLSAFAYKLICLNGEPYNSCVAQMQVNLLQNQNLKN